MRIAITHPTTLDRVARGNERYMHELAAWLAARGHEVTVIACKPGRTERVLKNGYTQESHRRIWHPALEKAGIIESYPFGLSTFLSLIRKKLDVVQACTHTSAIGADLARHFTGTPYVFFINGLPPPLRYFRALTLKGKIFNWAAANAAEIICVSDYVRRFARERFSRDGALVPVAVDTCVFQPPTAPRHSPPVILCASALDDRRKGGRPLVKAFSELKSSLPELQLWNAGATTEQTRSELLGLVDERWRKDVRFLGRVSSDKELSDLYGRASVTVLPSRWEAFGLVTIESMACGTPVVGTRDGALPEIINSPGVGRLFDPGEKDSVEPTDTGAIVRALAEALTLSRDPLTVDRCRERGKDFSWDRVGPMHEALYARLANTRR